MKCKNYFLYHIANSRIFICLGLSIIIKDFYDIEGDYLSAFSTLVAAGTAFFLVADWKEQSFLNLFQQTSRKTTSLCDELFDSYDNFKVFYMK